MPPPRRRRKITREKDKLHAVRRKSGPSAPGRAGPCTHEYRNGRANHAPSNTATDETHPGRREENGESSCRCRWATTRRQARRGGEQRMRWKWSSALVEHTSSRLPLETQVYRWSLQASRDPMHIESRRDAQLPLRHYHSRLRFRAPRPVWPGGFAGGIKHSPILTRWARFLQGEAVAPRRHDCKREWRTG